MRSVASASTLVGVIVVVGLLEVRPAAGELNNNFNTEEIFVLRGGTTAPAPWGSWESEVRRLNETKLDLPVPDVYNMDAGPFGTIADDTWPRAIKTPNKDSNGGQDQSYSKFLCFSNSPVPGQYAPAGARLFGVYDVRALDNGVDWNWTYHSSSFQIVELNSDGKRIRVMQVGLAAGAYAPTSYPPDYSECSWENTHPDSLLAPCAWGPNEGEWNRHNTDGCRVGTIRYNRAKNTLCVAAVVGEFGIETQYVPEALDPDPETDDPAYPRARVYEFELPDWPEVYYTAQNAPNADMVGEPIPQSDPSVVKLVQVYELATPHSAVANNGRFFNYHFRLAIDFDDAGYMYISSLWLNATTAPCWSLYSGAYRWQGECVPYHGDVVRVNTFGHRAGRNKYVIPVTGDDAGNLAVQSEVQAVMGHSHYWGGQGLAVRKVYNQLAQVPLNDCGCSFTHVFDTMARELSPFDSELKLLEVLSGNIIKPNDTCYVDGDPPPPGGFIFETTKKTMGAQYDEASNRVYFTNLQGDCGGVQNMMCLQKTAPPSYTVVGDLGYYLTVTNEDGSLPGILNQTWDAASPPGTVVDQIGACCNTSEGTCADNVSQTACYASGGLWQGNGTMCGQYACPGEGACCKPCGQGCDTTYESECTGWGSTWHGAGTSCAEIVCEVCSPQPMDADCDGDVDQSDFAAFQACFALDATPPSACACLDRGADAPAGDGDIDSHDLTVFELCASGPGIPGSATCVPAGP